MKLGLENGKQNMTFFRIYCRSMIIIVYTENRTNSQTKDKASKHKLTEKLVCFFCTIFGEMVHIETHYKENTKKNTTL